MRARRPLVHLGGASRPVMGCTFKQIIHLKGSLNSYYRSSKIVCLLKNVKLNFHEQGQSESVVPVVRLVTAVVPLASCLISYSVFSTALSAFLGLSRSRIFSL